MRTRSLGILRWSLVVVQVSMLVSPGEARSQEQVKAVSPITVGSRVRLLAPTAIQGRIEGTVMELDERSLLVSTDNHVPVRVERQTITHLEVSTGRRREALKGMIIGAAIGAVVFQTAVSDNCQNAIGGCFSSRAQATGIGLLGGALWGAGIGALFKTDRWSPVPLEHVRMSLAPTSGHGVRLSVSVGF